MVAAVVAAVAQAPVRHAGASLAVVHVEAPQVRVHYCIDYTLLLLVAAVLVVVDNAEKLTEEEEKERSK
jgi:hypothetical protein